MRALLLDDQLRVVDDYPQPSPAAGQALIRVLKAGICSTDLEVVRGYKSFRGVPGHEFVGIVEEHPDSAWIGERVVGEINLACGACENCRTGRPTHCSQRAVLGLQGHDGACAEYLTLPVVNLHRVPPDLPDDVALFTEPLAAAFEILQQIHVRPTDRVVLLGAGKLGLLCAQVLALTQCDLTVVGHHPPKLELAQTWGIATRLTASGQELPPALQQADVVVDCTGSPAGFDDALRLVRPRGTVVLNSTYHGRTEADMTAVVVKEVTVVGSRCGPFAPALRALAAGKVDVQPLIQARYPLQEAVAAFEKAAQPGILKVLLEVA